MYEGVERHIYIYMCYSQGDGLNTSLSRLSYLVTCTPASAEVVSSILTKVGFVFFFRNGKRGNVSK